LFEQKQPQKNVAAFEVYHIIGGKYDKYIWDYEKTVLFKVN